MEITASIRLDLTAQGVEADFVGQFASGGTSTLTAGTLDINDEDSTHAHHRQQRHLRRQLHRHRTTTGHGTLSFKNCLQVLPFQFAFYFVSPSQVFMLQIDDNFVTIGSALAQPTIP